MDGCTYKYRSNGTDENETNENGTNGNGTNPYGWGADEVAFLNITGYRDLPLTDAPMLEVLRRSSETVFVPLTVGGGIRDFTDSNGKAYTALEVASAYFSSGADKISIGQGRVHCLHCPLSVHTTTRNHATPHHTTPPHTAPVIKPRLDSTACHLCLATNVWNCMNRGLCVPQFKHLFENL